MAILTILVCLAGGCKFAQQPSAHPPPDSRSAAKATPGPSDGSPGGMTMGWLPGWNGPTGAWHPKLPILATRRGIVAIGRDVHIPREWRAQPTGPAYADMFAGCDWTRDGSRLVAARFVAAKPRLRERLPGGGRWELVSIDLSSGAAHTLVAEAGQRDEVAPRLSPTGDLVAFLSLRQQPPGLRGQLAVVPLGGGTARLVTDEREYPGWQPLWAPSGRSLTSQGWPVQVVSMPGGEVLPVGPTSGLSAAPWTWLDDKTLLCYGNDSRQPKLGLYAVALRAGDWHQVLAFPYTQEADMGPGEVSPDRHHIVCLAQPGDEVERLEVYDIRTGARRVLLSLPKVRSYDNPQFESMPCWSPDGSQIAYSVTNGYRPDGGELLEYWVIRPDGTHNRRVFP